MEEVVDFVNTRAHTRVEIDDNNSSSNSYSELDIQIEQIIEKKGSLWECKLCGKTSNLKTHAGYHAETHIEGVSHSCHICSKVSSTRKTLQQHILDIHSELISCNICEKTGMTRGAYRQHKQKNHSSKSF